MTAQGAALPTPSPETATDPMSLAIAQTVATLTELADDSSVPRNVRRGAQSAREALGKPQVALDVRVASAVYVLDDLANDPNLPTHGRTAIWSIISQLESLQ
jgi:uncharacterized protein (UPF0147 family)